VGECRRKKLVPSVDGLKPKEQEVPYDVVVDMALVKTGNDVVHTQLLFGVLEQRDKSSLTPIRQLVLSDCNVKPVLPLNCFPLATNSSDTSGRKRQLHRFLNANLVERAAIGNNFWFQPIIV